MAVDPKTLKTMFPEFESETNKRIQFFIDMAERKINRPIFGDKADDAVCLMSAHLLTLGSRGGNGGAITGEKVGDLSRNYSAGNSDKKGPHGSTSYGEMYDDLLRSCRAVPRVLGCQNP